MWRAEPGGHQAAAPAKARPPQHHFLLGPRSATAPALLRHILVEPEGCPSHERATQQTVAGSSPRTAHSESARRGLGSGGGWWGRELAGPHYDAAAQPVSPPSRYPPPPGLDAAGRLRYWNEVMLSANALDFFPQVSGDQPGPGRTSRAFAIVH